MKSTVVKRSIVLAGHKTSVSLEDDFLGRLEGYRQDQTSVAVRFSWQHRY